LWSLNEVNAYSISKDKVTKQYGVLLHDEPKSLSISSKFFVANFGLYIQIYQSAELIKCESNDNSKNVKFVKRDFASNINQVSLNSDSIAVLSEGRCHFFRMDGENEKIFPLKDTDDIIVQAYLTEEFLIYTDSTNRVRTFQITQTSSPCVAEYKFENKIKKIYPNEIGTKIICIDNYGKAYYYSPINEKVIPLKNDSEYLNVIWDYQDNNLFVCLTNSGLLYVFYVFEDSLEGMQVNMIKEYTKIEDVSDNPKSSNPCVMKLESNSFPFYLSNGYLYVFLKNSKEIKGYILLSHYWIFNWRDKNDNEDGHKKYFMQNYQLGRFSNCCKAANYLNTEKNLYYNHLGKACLNYLEIDISEESFRRAGNISLTLTVEKLRCESDKKILLGHIAAILGKEDKAEELFVSSSIPSLSVDLRCDLQDWNIALKLSKEYQAYREVFICKKLAYKHESDNNSAEAIKLYEKSKITNIISFLALLENDITNTSHRNCDSKDLEDHNTQCDAGIARCTLKLGDSNKAMAIATNLSNKQLVLEIAYLAESLSYSMEAAKLFTLVGMFEKAATIYIAIKQFKFAEDLIDKIKSTNLLVQLARMKENEKLYKDAEKAYERAGEWEHVIRLNLKFLNNVDKAKDIVLNKHKTEAAALLVAEYFENLGRKKETIEFKLIAKKYDEAFALAQTYNEMDAYAEFISNYVKSQDEFKKIAIYYEGKNKYGKSGIYYEKANNNQKALQMYIRSGEDEYLERAVEMVGMSNEDKLTNELIDHLLINNVESGPHFLIKLYIFLGNFSKACEIGIELSNQEAQLSNYKNAHKILWDLYVLLKDKNLPVSYDCSHRLAVLHSYILAKNRLIKHKLYLPAARNFLRVANNIQMFEKHVVEILTNLVLICNEAKLLKSASEWAFTLFDNAKYKDRLHANFKDTIAKIASKAYKNQEEPSEIRTPCPFCKTDIPEYCLTCSNCYNVIPFCIASGKHVTTFDLYCCPDCSFPAIGNELKPLLQKENTCPLCNKEIDLQLLEPVKDVVNFFKKRRVAKVEDKVKEGKEEKDIKEIEIKKAE
jgi:WD repeat-containing protein 19